MSEERKSTEADDVFEFLESLPNDGANEKVDDGNKKKGNKDEDIFEFLDELEKSNLKSKGKEAKVARKQEQPLEKEGAKQEPEETKPKEVEPVSNETVSKGTVENPEENEQDGEPLNDPITSISNWWTSSGSTAVSNLWSKTTEQASKVKDRIQKEQQTLTTTLPIKINTNTISELAKNLSRIVVGETEEVLRIHLVHDLVNYSNLQYYVESKFDQVLSSQVQGGIRIFVDEWGKPHQDDTTTISFINDNRRSLNLFVGKITDGEKLAFANLDNAIKLFNKAQEEISKQQKEAADGDDENEKNTNEDTKDNISDIFISILPISIPISGSKDVETDDILTTDSSQSGNFNFTIVLRDITNNITTITRSQGFPNKWAEWLEGTKDEDNTKQEEKSKKEEEEEEEEKEPANDEEGEIDPSDWVRDWIEDGLSLVFGVVAQNYVIDRMGLN
ncbi:hypothetical protein KAFR_0G01750 [Kazachstania africana CBS 2517]|uniref:Maintenance of telomere capping protein 1 n=1 Tax=Kazachstania africana (strain ATCC 22294 / BCRC 22015 / CBS 2517 / CECT 1963 / NBRC 1671 / NRRL Y-8276) TaxID=1071382 RepID=H2AXV9_KAZAF|nr:hypothetical protein KAFR_0G01750 [Kazachstania africana CBS 2517]CCF59209.1 hypothetical protein KAFR_0G01750 [Kazachstania africana CBS 2517]